jgi:hypothetical protein
MIILAVHMVVMIIGLMMECWLPRTYNKLASGLRLLIAVHALVEIMDKRCKKK